MLFLFLPLLELLLLELVGLKVLPDGEEELGKVSSNMLTEEWEAVLFDDLEENTELL